MKLKNQIWKDNFINFAPVNSRLNIDNLFSRISNLENKYDLDLCQFNQSQLIELFNLEPVQTQLAHQRVFVSNYLDFCYLKEYTKTTNIIKKENITLTKLTELNPFISNKRILYLSPKRYKEYLKEIEKDVNGVYFKAIVMSIYEGILGKFFENLVFLSTDDIDRDKSTVRLHKGKEIKVSKELITQLVAASNQDVMITKNKQMVLEDVLENNSIFKTYSKAKSSYSKRLTSARRKFYTYIPKYIAPIVDNDDLTANMIYTSGLVNYVLQKLEENNQDLATDKKAVEQYLKEFGIEISYKYFRTYYYKYINSYYKEK